MNFSSIAQHSVPMNYNSIPRRMGFIEKITEKINKTNYKAAYENKNRKNTIGNYTNCVYAPREVCVSFVIRAYIYICT